MPHWHRNRPILPCLEGDEPAISTESSRREKEAPPACLLRVLFIHIHPEGFQTTDDPEALYLLAGKDVTQSLWREADVSLISAPSPSPAG